MIHMSHLSFVQCEQIKFRSKKNVKMKVSHSVVAAWIVEGMRGGGGKRDFMSCHFCTFFNLISFTISNKA